MGAGRSGAPAEQRSEKGTQGVRAARSITAVALLTACALVPAGSAASAAQSRDGFWTAQAAAMTAANGWTLQGTAVVSGTLRLAPSPAPLACASAMIDGGSAAYDAAQGLCAGRDPHGTSDDGSYPYYNGGRFHYGVALSPPYQAAAFDQAVASWVAATPPGTWLEVHLRVRLESGAWTRWYDLPIWASGTQTVKRHAVDGQGGAATVATDTLLVRGGHVATAYQLSLTLFSAGTATPTLWRLSLASSRASAALDPPAVRSALWGDDLPVPARSQMLARYRLSSYGGGGEAWCSPTAASMLLAYWARVLHRPDFQESVPQAAQGTYDWAYAGTGDWPFNVAHATAFAGMDGYVARFPSLAVLEPWIAADVPLALSIAFGPGALPGAPIPASQGHLVVLRGFDHAGNPIVNDPAASDDATVRRIYPRAAFERAWLTGSQGTAYVIYPRGQRVPAIER